MPLVECIKKEAVHLIPKMSYNLAAVHNFQNLKHLLSSTPVLAYLQYHGQWFNLDTNFSLNPWAI